MIEVNIDKLINELQTELDKRINERESMMRKEYELRKDETETTGFLRKVTVKRYIDYEHFINSNYRFIL